MTRRSVQRQARLSLPRQLRRAILWLLALCLLAACGSDHAVRATSTVVATALAMPTARSTSTPTALPLPADTPATTPIPAPTTTSTPTATAAPTVTPTPTSTATPTPTPTPVHPLMIEHMRQQSYPGSDIVIEQTLDAGSNYDRYIASYLSEELKIYALLTVPRGEQPVTGWPVIVFNHGYIPPEQYRTTERYVAYVDAFAKNGYIVFKSDYRGHGSSEGDTSTRHSTPAYTIDVLNALASLKRYGDADPDRIGMWGHSMGGRITLRAMVVSDEIKAGVMWAGSYRENLERWLRPDRTPTPDLTSTPDARGVRRRWLQELLDAYGAPEENPAFWRSISPNAYLSDLSGPVQLHHGTADTSVPVEHSETLYTQIQQAGKPVELYTYEGDNHNISNSFATAMQRSIQFFDRHVKGAGVTATCE